MDHADLWPVAVRDDDLRILADQICDCFCGALCRLFLLRQRRSERLMSECYDNFSFFHAVFHSVFLHGNFLYNANL